MGKTYLPGTSGAIFKNVIRFSEPAPLDGRAVVDSYADIAGDAYLTLFNEGGVATWYTGMLVVTKDTGKVYVLVEKNRTIIVTETVDGVEVEREEIETYTEFDEVSPDLSNVLGSLSVDKYSDAIELATSGNIGQVIYVKESETIDEDGEEGEGSPVTYDAAPYIVIGSGQLMKLAASTASGDIESDVAALKTKVGDDNGGLVKDVKDNASAISANTSTISEHAAAISANTSAISEHAAAISANASAISEHAAAISANTDAISGKVEQSEYNEKIASVDASLSGLSTSVETINGKLSGIAENAQVNVIETIKVNGTALDVNNKEVNIEVEVPKVKNVDGADKMLRLDENGLIKSELSIKYVSASESSDGKPHLSLFGISGTTLIDSIDATDFVKDGMLHDVALVDNDEGKKVLRFTWNTDVEGISGSTLDVPVTDLIDYYHAGDGISLDSERKFNIDLKEGETILTVDAAGLGINQSVLWTSADTRYDKLNAATTAEQNAKDYADDLNEAMTARMDELSANTAGIVANASVLSGITSTQVSNWDAAEQNANSYADGKFATLDDFNGFKDAYEEKIKGIENGAEINVIESVKFNGVELDVTDKSVDIEVNANNIELGEAITTDGGEVKEDNSNIKYSADTKVSVVLQSIYSSIKQAEAGGVHSITASDKSIEVNTNDLTTPTLKVRVSNEDGNLLELKDDGLFVGMYYDGDDSEIVE